MHRASSNVVCAITIAGLLISGGCGGGDNGPVAQVPTSVSINPSVVAFGAIGSQHQLSVTVKDQNGADISSPPAPTWARAGAGTTASVSASGLVTAVAVGAGDTAVATVAGITAKAPITVTQVAATVTVSSTGIDTLKTTGSTKQYTAVAKDSNANAIGSATISWSSNNTAAATVNSGSGLATAASADGGANITATSGSASGFKTLVVRHFAKTFTLSPNTAQAISTPGGTISFTGVAQDSANTNLTITWTSDNTAVLTMSPASGTSSTATAKANGSANVTMAGGTLSSSVGVTVSGQPTAPPSAGVTVGDDFFTSVRNATSNPAVDTIAAGGTVTWTWGTSFNPHSVQSTGTPSFTSSATQTGSGKSYQFTFSTAGTYTYDCAVHGAAMTGRIVVQ